MGGTAYSHLRGSILEDVLEIATLCVKGERNTPIMCVSRYIRQLHVKFDNSPHYKSHMCTCVFSVGGGGNSFGVKVQVTLEQTYTAVVIIQAFTAEHKALTDPPPLWLYNMLSW